MSAAVPRSAGRARGSARSMPPMSWRAARRQFALPRAADGSALTYLCGHSLGLAPLAARARVLEELEDWERLGVCGPRTRRGAPGSAMPSDCSPLLAPLAGAAPPKSWR